MSGAWAAILYAGPAAESALLMTCRQLILSVVLARVPDRASQSATIPESDRCVRFLNRARVTWGALPGLSARCGQACSRLANRSAVRRRRSASPLSSRAQTRRGVDPDHLMCGLPRAIGKDACEAAVFITAPMIAAAASASASPQNAYVRWADDGGMLRSKSGCAPTRSLAKPSKRAWFDP